MTDLHTHTSDRLEDVLAGFPRGVLPAATAERLFHYLQGFDAIGRYDPTAGEALIDEQTLHALLREFIDNDTSVALIETLERLPAPQLRGSLQAGAPCEEIPWFRIADDVIIFDDERTATYDEVELLGGATTSQIVAAVQRRFPSMEPDLLDPDSIPPRLMELVADRPAMEKVLQLVERQLGWWAAVAAVLLIPLAALTMAPPTGSDAARRRNAWPVGMFAAAAGVGGWTLTVVGSIVLAPLD